MRRPLLAVHVGDLDLVEVGHRLLDVLDADLAVLDRQQVAQRFAHQLDVDGAAAETRVGEDVLQRAFEFAHVGAHVLGDEEGDVLGQLLALGLRLVHQDGDAHFQARRLHRHAQAGIETRHQALRDVGQALGIGVAGHHDMALLGQQRLEGVEEFFLCLFLAGEELHVVDQQQVERVVARLELVEGVAARGGDHVVHELFGVDVEHACLRALLQQLVAHRLQQVRLAQADAAIDEQRVVLDAGLARHMQRGGARHAVGRAFDQVVESAVAVQPRIVLRGVADWQLVGCQYRNRYGQVRHRCRGGMARGSLLLLACGLDHGGACHRRARGAGGNRQLDRHRAVGQLFQHHFHALQELAADPVQLEAVGDLDHQPVAVGVRARQQRLEPGVELLRRHFLGQHVHAGVPQGSVSGFSGGGKGFCRHVGMANEQILLWESCLDTAGRGSEPAVGPLCLA